VYDYVDGKADWMAYGLPVEGADGPFLGDDLVAATTCDVHATVGEVRSLLGDDPVIVLADGLAVGEVDAGTLDGRDDGEKLLDVMDPVPTTVRPSVTFAAAAEDGGGRQLVTTSDGRLVGQAFVDAHDHDHEHDDVDEEAFDRELASVMAAVEERFGDREPSEEELRAFLRERLVAEGRSPEDADRFLDELQAGDS
jgi:hypothetical protein